MKFLSLAFLFTVFSFSSANANFSDFSPSSKRIDGVSYPRFNGKQFRGTFDYQLTEAQALKAFFGDKNITVASRFFETIKHKLQGKDFVAKVELSRYLEKKIKTLVSENKNVFDSEKSLVLTKKLMKETFAHYKKSSQVRKKYLDYNSHEYIDWPTDLVFTTLISPVAGTYGEKVLVFQDAHKGIDLNYWNYVNSGVWSLHSRDLAEFIHFGFISGEELVSYENRSGRKKSWHKIESSLSKITHKGFAFAVLLDGVSELGNDVNCLNYDKQKVRLCDYTPGEIAKAPPVAKSESPLLVGLFHQCESNSCWDALKEVESSYKPSSNQKLMNRAEVLLDSFKAGLSFEVYKR